MKFDCGETWIEKKIRLEQWHRWFAWRPVAVAPHDCRWLEYVERKGERYIGCSGSCWDWEYRPAPRPLSFKEQIIADALVELEQRGEIKFLYPRGVTRK